MAAKPRPRTPASTDPSPPKDVTPPNGVVLHDGLTLLEVAEAADLSALLADPRLGDLVVVRLSGTEAAVLPEHHQAFVKALLKAGHTPKVG